MKVKIGDEYDSLRSMQVSQRWRVVSINEDTGVIIIKMVGTRHGPPPRGWRENRRRALAFDRFAGWPLVMKDDGDDTPAKGITFEALTNSSDYCRVTETVQGGIFAEALAAGDAVIKGTPDED